ncbi:MAG: YlbF family regulator [Streptococcaceae bacterium]|jgi:cell fate (sporulation/competence/biofilm development) regulator YlbF (YheA/YmcA/DUF963 family)|nr:YlbF family regulator [Streptococcaceae bacterium]
MVITENLFAIEEKVKELAYLIALSDQAKKYRLASRKYLENRKATLLEQKLRSAYDAFLQVQKYNPHTQDYKEKKHAFYHAKRAFDLYESVADLRLAQMDMQNILDEISKKIASKVSKKIVVKTGNPFSEYKSKLSCQNHCLHQKERLR